MSEAKENKTVFGFSEKVDPDSVMTLKVKESRRSEPAGTNAGVIGSGMKNTQTPVNGGVKESGSAVARSLLRCGSLRKMDLHMHTTISDGTDTPEQLLAYLRETDIPLFSVTDHDSIKACGIIRDHLRKGDPHFIAGAEFSCKDEDGQYHILGYGFDPEERSIQKLMEISHNNRIRKTRARLSCLEKEYNITFPDEEVKKLYALDNPGKPHIGNLMAKYGYAPTKDAAISTILNKIHTLIEYLRPEETIIGILDAGGIPVLAHPFFGSGEQLIIGEKMEERLKKLVGYGLKGVEAFYSVFSGDQIKEMLSLGEQYDLYVTAGSDYHGRNKKTIPGVTGMDSVEEIPAGLKRFLEDVTYVL